MENIIQQYLENDISFLELGEIHKIDRKTLSRRVNKLYPNHRVIQFINISNRIHFSKYDYSLVNSIIRVREKVQIICPEHGIFEQDVHNHKKGRGCPRCAWKEKALKASDNKESFIYKCRLVHGDRFNYDKVEYINTNIKVIITCKIHGDFIQQADSHKQGNGCPYCYNENRGWNRTAWKKMGKNKLAKLYILRCYSETEQFIKIGRTFNSVKRRFGSKTEMPYKYEIIKLIENSNYDIIWDLEVELKRKYKNNSYTPQIYFDGITECFDINILEELRELH